MMRLDILGPFALSAAPGRDIAVPSRKTRALLALLALAPRGRVTRDHLCGMFWGDRAEEQARNSLRQTLSVLRTSLGPEAGQLLLVRDDTLELNAEGTVVDAREFLRLAGTGDLPSLRSAAALWRGEILSDSTLREAAFEDWLATERRHFTERATTVLDALAERDSGTQRVEAARRLVALDPLREASHRRLMQALADAGEAALALQQFETCRQQLRESVGVAPSPETRALFEAIRAGGRTGAPVPSSRAAPVPEPSPVETVQGDSSIPAGIPLLIQPFTEMGEGLALVGLATALTEEVIHGLSRFAEVSVRQDRTAVGDGPSARGGWFQLSGSVQRSASGCRISARLTDLSGGAVVWSLRKDYGADDALAIQDAFTEACVYGIVGAVTATATRSRGRHLPSGTVMDLFVRGRGQTYLFNAEAMAQARTLLAEAIRLAPGFAPAHAWMSYAIWTEWWAGWHDRRSEALGLALDSARRAVELDTADSHALSALGQVHLYLGDRALAREALDRSIRLNPHDPDALVVLAFFHLYEGALDEAEAVIEGVMRRDPTGHYGMILGMIRFHQQRWDEALVAFRMMRAKFDWAGGYVAAALALKGEEKAARSEAARIADARPGPSPGLGEQILSRNPYVRLQDRDLVLAGLFRAGL